MPGSRRTPTRWAPSSASCCRSGRSRRGGTSWDRCRWASSRTPSCARGCSRCPARCPPAPPARTVRPRPGRRCRPPAAGALPGCWSLLQPSRRVAVVRHRGIRWLSAEHRPAEPTRDGGRPGGGRGRPARRHRRVPPARRDPIGGSRHRDRRRRLDQRHAGQRPAHRTGDARGWRPNHGRHHHPNLPAGWPLMPEVVLKLMQLGILVLLWVFVLSAVRVVRSDLFGGAPPRVAAPLSRPVRQDRAERPRRRSAARKLVVTQGALAGTTVTLGSQPVTIGRSNDSTLVLTDDYASTRHARLVPTEGAWLVEDMGSTNGTYLDRTKVARPTPVPLGTPVRIGKTVL